MISLSLKVRSIIKKEGVNPLDFSFKDCPLSSCTANVQKKPSSFKIIFDMFMTDIIHITYSTFEF